MGELSKKEFEYVIKTVRHTYNDVNIANLIHVILHTMEIIEDYGALTGQEKKQTVINVINFIVDEINKNEELGPIIKSMIPSVIDSIIKVDKGSIKINKKSICLPCLRAK